MCHSLVRLLLLGLIWLPVSPLLAAKNDWAEGTSGQNNEASRDYYNRAGLLKWTNFRGDWRDRQNTPQGNTPYGQTAVENSSEAFIEWEVTALVEA